MAFLYPWGNTQQLNLDWILQKIKELEAANIGSVLDEVANALIAASYARQAYDRSDIVFYDGKLYRANQAIPAPGEVWTPAHWDEILLGDAVSNLVQYVAALSNDQIVNSSSVSGDHTSDALDTLKNAIDGITLDSDSVSNESQVTGDNVSDALDTLNGAMGSLQEQITENVETSTTASKAYGIGEYLTLNGVLYRVKSNIASGATITVGTNVEEKSINSAISNIMVFKTEELTLNLNAGVSVVALGQQVVDPTGYKYLTAVVTYGSTVGIRNGVVFMGLTANHSSAAFYTASAVTGDISLRYYFVKEQNITQN